MTDRELLERAAKAAGYVVHGWIGERFVVNFGDGARGNWNPLADDGDALRLAVKLDMRLDVLTIYEGGKVYRRCAAQAMNGKDCVEQLGGGDENLRRAIVRAAASLSQGEE